MDEVLGKRHGLAALVALAVFCGLVLAPGAGAAPSNYTWNGQNALVAGDTEGWSQGNWTNGAPIADQSVGTLSFPDLSSCMIGISVCYQSDDDLPGLSAEHLSIDDTQGYELTDQGNTLDLSSGITAAPDSTPSGSVPQMFLPIQLSADQSWSITGAGFSSFQIGALTLYNVSGIGKTLAISLSDAGRLNALSDGIEAGAVTITGASTADFGQTSQKNGAVIATDLNGLDGSDVKLSRVALLDQPRISGIPTTTRVGPLHLTGGELVVGAGVAPDAILKVKGGVSIDRNSLTFMTLDQSGTEPSTDFPQIQASGKVTLSGILTLDEGGNSAGDCVLKTGSTATLVKTTGELAGTFARVFNGAVVPIAGNAQPADCQGGDQSLAAIIRYTADALTATVVSPKTTETGISAATRDPTAGKSDALSAEVSTGTNLTFGPTGTVEFRAGGKAIKGCSSVKTKPLNLPYATASCSAKFAAGKNIRVTATYKPKSGLGVDSSTSPAASFTVKKG